jgi:hypothetical protein
MVECDTGLGPCPKLDSQTPFHTVGLVYAYVVLDDPWPGDAVYINLSPSYLWNIKAVCPCAATLWGTCVSLALAFTGQNPMTREVYVSIRYYRSVLVGSAEYNGN